MRISRSKNPGDLSPSSGRSDGWKNLSLLCVENTRERGPKFSYKLGWRRKLGSRLHPRPGSLSLSLSGIEIHSCMCSFARNMFYGRRRIYTINTREMPRRSYARGQIDESGREIQRYFIRGIYKVLFRRNFQDAALPRSDWTRARSLQKKHSICRPYHARKLYSLPLVYSSPLCLALCPESSSSRLRPRGETYLSTQRNVVVSVVYRECA